MQEYVVEIYKGYELIKYISNANDVIYNANSIDKNPSKITCSADNLAGLKKQVDHVWELIFAYKKLEYRRKAKNRNR